MFLLYYGILFFKFKVKLVEPSSCYACLMESQKISDTPFPKFSLKTLKKHLLKA